MLKPKSLFVLTSQQQRALGGVLLLLGLIFFLQTSSKLASDARPSNSDEKLSTASKKTEGKDSGAAAVVRIHATDVFVPASAFSNVLKMPLEVVQGTTVACPERGGKNTQCGKVSAEYRFKVPEAGDYYIYFQVLAPGLNDNSLWVGLASGGDASVFDACETPAQVGSLIPHKHLTSSKRFLCCPAYLGKNKKKGLAGFYSDCCYQGLGKDGSETACVLDLEVDDQPRWNQLPRTIRTSEEGEIVAVRVYAREDGTAWSGLVLSASSALDDKAISKLKRSSVQ